MSEAWARPVRADDAQESNRLADARRDGPFVAWRDTAEVLRVLALTPDQPVTAGRAVENTVVFERGLVSRDHVEVLLRVRGELRDVSVFLLDLRSKQGTIYRPVTLERGAERPSGSLRPVPVAPARPVQLRPGDYDVGLAGAVWMRVGGVPFDPGMTHVRDRQGPAPTQREHDVLVELCRPQFERGTAVATPSNAEIGALVEPRIGAARVSDLISAMYAKYGLHGTKEQNRISLADLALTHGFVGPEDYM